MQFLHLVTFCVLLSPSLNVTHKSDVSISGEKGGGAGTARVFSVGGSVRSAKGGGLWWENQWSGLKWD